MVHSECSRRISMTLEICNLEHGVKSVKEGERGDERREQQRDVTTLFMLLILLISRAKQTHTR